MKNNISEFLSSASTSINRAIKQVEESVTNVETTQFDPDMQCLINRTDLIQKNVRDLIYNTTCLIFPNPALRAEQAIVEKLKAPVREKQSNSEVLGEQFSQIGSTVLENTELGSLMSRIGQTQTCIAGSEKEYERKMLLEFIEPLRKFLNEDCKRAAEVKKDLYTIRLDLDIAKKYEKNTREDNKTYAHEQVRMKNQTFEHKVAFAKRELKTFEENFLKSELNSSKSPLMKTFVQAQLDYHKNCVNHLENLSSSFDSPQFTNIEITDGFLNQ